VSSARLPRNRNPRVARPSPHLAKSRFPGSPRANSPPASRQVPPALKFSSSSRMNAATQMIIILTCFSSGLPSCLISAALAIFAFKTHCGSGTRPNISPACRSIIRAKSFASRPSTVCRTSILSTPPALRGISYLPNTGLLGSERSTTPLNRLCNRSNNSIVPTRSRSLLIKGMKSASFAASRDRK
jgi:hypothetical protein